MNEICFFTYLLTNNIRYRIEKKCITLHLPSQSLENVFYPVILDRKIDKEVKPTPLTYHLENWNPKKTPSWK